MAEENKKYAYLPEDLLAKMLDNSSKTAQQLTQIFDLNDSAIQESRDILQKGKFINECLEGESTNSIMAADGASIIEHKTSADIILSLAVGIDGLSSENSSQWAKKARQFQEWQTVLPHHVANTRLAQGIMFLMELNVLSENDREIRIMDGSHLTVILKLNSLLSANDDDKASNPYVDALKSFLKESYEKIIPDIPNIIDNAFSNESIIALTKYSSSREIIDSLLSDLKIQSDDKVLMSSILKEKSIHKAYAFWSIKGRER